MRVYYCTTFKGHYPVGTAAVIVARNRVEAKNVLMKQLKAVRLEQKLTVQDLTEITTHTSKAYILNDGDY